MLTGIMPRKRTKLNQDLIWHSSYSCPQSCTPTRIRRRSALKRFSVLHVVVHTLCWLYLGASPFVSLPTNTYEDLVHDAHRNMILSHFGKPSKYLPWCMVIWGMLSVCTGDTFLKIFWP